MKTDDPIVQVKSARDALLAVHADVVGLPCWVRPAWRTNAGWKRCDTRDELAHYVDQAIRASPSGEAGLRRDPATA